MQRPKTFQMVIMGIFIVMLFLGFLGFSGKIPLPSSKDNINYGEVTLWGTLPSETMQSLISDALTNEQGIVINYAEKKNETLYRDFVESLARGNGPDLILLPQSEMMKNLDKLSSISYQTVAERDFKNTFLEIGELFMRPDGIIALPFTLDPMVMYWNRDLFTNAGAVTPPTQWKELYDLAPKITVRDRSGNISQSLVAFGEYRNVAHAKEVLAILLMQAGSPIVQSQNGILSAGLVSSGGTNIENPVLSAIRFYTEFSKSDKDSYSWNRSLPNSRTLFEAGDLALYFGYASEYPSIKQKNPHLNFDVAVMPQASDAPVKITFGQMQGIALVRASKNPTGAFHAATILSGKNVVDSISKTLGIPPVRRDLIVVRPGDSAQSVFYDSALIARAWHDPSSTESNTLFMNMVDDITSERSSMSQALMTAQSSLTKLLQSVGK